MKSEQQILANIEAFLDGWDFGDDEMQAEADALLKDVREWLEEFPALPEPAE